MNGKQKAVIAGAGVLGVGAIAGYAFLHPEAAAAAASTSAQAIEKEGWAALINSQRVGLIATAVPPYPQTYFGLSFPVTRFAVADGIWQAWWQYAQKYQTTIDMMLSMLQTVSDEVGDRLGVSSPTWALALVGTSVVPAVGGSVTFDAIFGDAARQTTGGDFFTALEAEQFWVGITNVATQMNYFDAYSPSVWTDIVGVVKGVAAEFANIPATYAEWTKDVVQWAAHGVTGIATGALDGLFAGLFSSWLVPAVILVGAVAGGSLLYRELA